MGSHFSMDFSLKRLCKIGIFAILRSPRCATSTFFDENISWFCSVVNSTCRKRYTYTTFVMSSKGESLGLLEGSLAATWAPRGEKSKKGWFVERPWPPHLGQKPFKTLAISYFLGKANEIKKLMQVKKKSRASLQVGSVPPLKKPQTTGPRDVGTRAEGMWAQGPMGHRAAGMWLEGQFTHLRTLHIVP